MALTPKDRREKLLASSTLNGIDFVEVTSADQRTLRVHFLNHVDVSGSVTNPQITGGEAIRTVVANPINNATDWSVDAEGRPILQLTVVAAGDFSFYTLRLKSTLLDQFFSESVFSFKATCPSDLDCEKVLPPCPAPPGNPPPIDYLAKDFLSFRKALLDFSALRYPAWQERAEADFGVMFLEALAGLADDLSYTQDRVAAEAALDTATQRRSIVRLARLVDYEPRPAVAATVVLQFNVSAGPFISAGLQVSGLSPEGQPIVFETGTSLVDPTKYAVSPKWNAPLQPYYFDDSQLCLKAGSTQTWILGHGLAFQSGQALLIDTKAPVPADPPIREVVHITSANEEVDPLFLDSNSNPIQVTHITWDGKEALRYSHDLARTTLAGNLVPATQGGRLSESFAIDTPPISDPHTRLAAVRTAMNSMPDSFSPMYLHTLSSTPLVWLAADPKSSPLPEIQMIETPPGDPPFAWTWRRSMLDAEPQETAFTVDRANFVPFAQNSNGSTSYEYDGDAGDTIRFGNGNFGSRPEAGAVFRVNYRVGAGADGNLAADSITRFDAAASPSVQSVTNPFAASGGADQESNETVRRLSPQAFRTVQFRAVRPEDYVAAAEGLDWVQRAGTVFRWTGSWLTVFTTADPKASEEITIAEELEVIRLLDRRRLAGYESYAPAPHYISVDLEIYLCAKPDAFRGDVKQGALLALSAVTNPDGTIGFFHPDNFTFGKPLERSALEGAIQAAYGVAGVHSIKYRRRGIILNYIELPDQVTPGPSEILRVDNDPSLPERGSVRVYVEGGK
jgi:hypothetical protein